MLSMIQNPGTAYVIPDSLFSLPLPQGHQATSMLSRLHPGSRLLPFHRAAVIFLRLALFSSAGGFYVAVFAVISGFRAFSAT